MGHGAGLELGVAGLHSPGQGGRVWRGRRVDGGAKVAGATAGAPAGAQHHRALQILHRVPGPEKERRKFMARDSVGALKNTGGCMKYKAKSPRGLFSDLYPPP